MRISDWSSDVCSSDLRWCRARCRPGQSQQYGKEFLPWVGLMPFAVEYASQTWQRSVLLIDHRIDSQCRPARLPPSSSPQGRAPVCNHKNTRCCTRRSEEPTSELQSLISITYAV